MKRTVKILVTLVLAVLLLASCGKAEKTLIYGDTDLSEYVTLGEYKGLVIDKSSDEFKNEFNEVFKSDCQNNDVFTKKLDGKVQNGDTANIDYEGKKDGVAFEGGTAQGYDLTIGSGTFIPGFEEGLIGVNIGDTVDLNLTFPENYGSAELAGAAVVFTVKVNYVKSSEGASIEDSYEQLGFSSAKEYKEDIENRAAKNLLTDKIIANSEIKDYPEKDRDNLIDSIYEYYDSYYTENYNVKFEDVLSENNMTVDDFRNEMSSNIESEMKNQMVYYAILQKEKLKADYELEEKQTTNQAVLDEITKVGKVVEDFVYKNASIKG